MEKPAAQRLAALDTLRGLAVLLVLARHMPLPKGVSPWLDVPLRTLERGGWIGVDLFFVLSGFLVSGLLFREWSRHGELRAGRFLIRRGFKIYPAFYVMLAVVLVWAGAIGRWPGTSNVLTEVFFLQSYGAGFFPHTWSLAVEEHFYLLLPLLLFLVRGTKERPFAALPALFAGVAIGCLALRVAGAWGQTQVSRAGFMSTHLRIDSLFFGVLIAWLMHFRGALVGPLVMRWRWGMLAAALALATPAFVFDLNRTWYLFTFGLTAFYLAGGLLLLLALHHPMRSGALAWVGIYSYSIYLWHIPVDRLILRVLLPRDVDPLQFLAAYFLGSIAVGVLAAWIVELPFLRLRDRWFPSGSEAARTEARPPLDVTAPALTTRGHVA